MPEPAFLPVSGDRIERPQSTYEDVCDTRLWMMDMEGDCRRVIEAMPPERRARFDRVVFTSGEQLDQALWQRFVTETVVYCAFTAEGYAWVVPLDQALLQDVANPEAVAEMLLSTAEWWLSEQEQEAPPA